MIVDERTAIAYGMIGFFIGAFFGYIWGKEQGFRKGFWAGMRSTLGVRGFGGAKAGRYDNISH
jgi:hypothetical protein